MGCRTQVSGDSKLATGEELKNAAGTSMADRQGHQRMVGLSTVQQVTGEHAQVLTKTRSSPRRPLVMRRSSSRYRVSNVDVRMSRLGLRLEGSCGRVTSGNLPRKLPMPPAMCQQEASGVLAP